MSILVTGQRGVKLQAARDHDRPQGYATRCAAVPALRKGLLPCLQVSFEFIISLGLVEILFETFFLLGMDFVYGCGSGFISEILYCKGSFAAVHV